MDGVRANSQVEIIKQLNLRLGTSLEFSKWVEFDQLTRLAIELSGESAAVVAGWLYATDVMREALPFPHSQEVIRELATLGIQLAVCTSRPAEQALATVQWMKHYFPEVTNVFVRNGEVPGLRGNEFKLQIAQRVGANVVVDDDTTMIRAHVALLQEEKFSTLKQPIITDRPWNNRDQFPPQVLRVGDWINGNYGWHDIYIAITSLASKKS